MGQSNGMYRNSIKRLFDFVASLVAFIILLPVFVVLTIILLIVNNGKPFFLQARPGKDEKIFRVIKFKTMNDRTDEHGELLPDKQRTTAIGKFIRNSSLDEIPQLLNVIAGHMSLVGPRPLLIEYLPHYNARQRTRHHVRPGITGWAQVNGRNGLSWSKKFEFDAWYVEHISFLLDCKIMWMTVQKVFAAKDINFSDSVTMTRFVGNNEGQMSSTSNH